VPLSSATGFAVSLAASFALFEYVETPMRRIIRGWSNRVDLRVEPAA
jgi:peptidoglycan/LPS O-acetylase OafA/YrhL